MLERDFQKKRKIRNIIYSKTTVVLLFFMIIILGRATWSMYRTKAQGQADFERVSATLVDLQNRQKALVSDIDRLKTEKGTEEEIRKKFSVAKEGETVVFLIEHESAVPPAPIEEKSFLKKVWSGFLSVFE